MRIEQFIKRIILQKDELEDIFNSLVMVIDCLDVPERFHILRDKILSIIDNYCEPTKTNNDCPMHFGTYKKLFSTNIKPTHLQYM